MGYGISGRAWAPLAPAFDGFRLIMFDNRGTGRSDKPAAGYSIEAMAADALAVMDAAGIERCSVLGVSMGGMIAQQLALEAPERVERLVLCCTTPGVGAPGQGDVQALFDLVEGTKLMTSDPARAIQILAPILLAPANQPLLASLIGLLGAGAQGLPAEFAAPDVADRVMTSIASYSSLARLAEIDAPTLVQHGDLDRIVPVEHGRAIAERVPGAQMHVSSGCGHLYLLEDPAALPTIAAFLRQESA
jgi:pimeloyl-ACP methyl ester carboxylesterase